MSAVWSLSGGKRTWRLPAPTSEFDPTRTSAVSLDNFILTGPDVFQMSSLDSYTAHSDLWGRYAATRVYGGTGWRDSGVAARGTSAATGDAGKSMRLALFRIECEATRILRGRSR
jgi:hypothetical protein